MEKKFPVFQLLINEADTTGVSYVALVDNPAIQLQWQAFSEQQRFKIMSEEKQIVSGALMVANMPIYRNSVQMGEHYVVFSPETISQIAMKFFKDGNINNVNLMHDPAAKVEGVTMFESFLVDSSRGINPPTGYGNLTDGSWFGSYKIDNPEVWKAVKDGTFKGFSVEGFFDYGTAKTIDQSQVQNIENVILSEANVTTSTSSYNSTESKFMEILKSIIGEDAYGKLQKFMDAPVPPAAPAPTAPQGTDPNKAISKDGLVIYTDKGFVEGAQATTDSDTGKIPVGDGKYELDNQLTITVQGGVIVSVEDTVSNEPPQDQAMTEVMNRLSALESKLGGFATVDQFNTENLSMKEAMKTVMDSMNKLAEAVKGTVSTQPAAPAPSAFKSQKQNAISELQQSLQNLKIN